MWIQLSDEDQKSLEILINTAYPSPHADIIRRRLEHYRSPEVNNQAYRDAVVTTDGELEVDDDAVVSVSESGGAYVMAWVWVSTIDDSDCTQGHKFTTNDDAIDVCDRCGHEEIP